MRAISSKTGRGWATRQWGLNIPVDAEKALLELKTTQFVRIFQESQLQPRYMEAVATADEQRRGKRGGGYQRVVLDQPTRGGYTPWTPNGRAEELFFLLGEVGGVGRSGLVKNK
jgi:hypothetical protein